MTNQGVEWSGTLREGQAGFVPRGAGHYLYNPTSEPAYFAVVFNNAKFSTTSLPGFIGNLPLEVSGYEVRCMYRHLLQGINFRAEPCVAQVMLAHVRSSSIAFALWLTLQTCFMHC